MIEDSFTKLPSVYSLTPPSHGKPEARAHALYGFGEHANVYVDLLTGFRIGRIGDTDEVAATLTFDTAPELVIRPNNTFMPGPAVPLKSGTIEIRNLPDPMFCSEFDYLLHYFATMMSLRGKPPLWKEPGGCLPKQQARAKGDPPSPDVYCSSSGYP